MKNTIRRILSLLLALTLAVTPLTAAAEGRTEDTDEPEIIEQIPEETPEESSEETESPEESTPTEPEETEVPIPDETAPEETEEPTEDSEELPHDASVLASIVDSGTCGTNVTWTLDSDGLLTISGSGKMKDYSFFNNSPWDEHNRAIRSVIIEEGITSIGDCAFFDCYNLERVSIADGVTRIGEYAFSSNRSLVSVDIPKSVITIDDGAFEQCDSLTNVVLPNGVTSIGSEAFYSCDSLVSVIIPESVTTIGEMAFEYCRSLKSIDIPDSVTYIYYNTFSQCKNLKNVVIGDGVEAIEESAFSGCGALTSVKLGKSIQSIGEYAFSYCIHLPEIVLPDSLVSIGESAFSGCWELKSISVPDKVTEIGDYAFSACNSLEEVYLGRSVADIGYNAFVTNSHPEMFGEVQSSLRAITVSSSNSVFSSQDGVLFNKAKTTLVQYPGGKGYQYSIPNGVSVVGENAFACCLGLTSITIPRSVTLIQNRAFSWCNALSEVRYLGTKAEWCEIIFKDGNAYLTECRIHCSDGIYTHLPAGSFGENLSWRIEDGLLTISGTGAMPNYGEYDDEIEEFISAPWHNYTSVIREIEIEQGVTSIGSYAFTWCNNVTSVRIPDSVETIGDNAFGGCSALDGLTIPDGVTSIGDSAFSSCESMTSVVIPESTTSIGNGAFSYCSSLRSVTILSKRATIGEYAFMDCYELVDVVLSDGISSIGMDAFTYCQSLTSVKIPDGITNLDRSLFGHCNNLYSITIPKSVTTISDSAFYSCSNLTEVIFLGTKAEWRQIEIDFGNDNLTISRIICTDGIFAPVEFSGTCGENLTWRYADHTLTVSGSGSVKGLNNPEFSFDVVRTIILTEGISIIEEDAFIECSGLNTLIFPRSLKRIGDYAFFAKGGNNLTDIYYAGSAQEWAAVEIGDGNYLEGTMHYNYIQPFVPDDNDEVTDHPIAIEQEYLTIAVGTSINLKLRNSSPVQESQVFWSVEKTDSGDDVITIDQNGVVKALTPGTAFAVASVAVRGEMCSARCRIDVVPKTESGDSIASEVAINGVTLLDTKATAELYHTDYTRISVLLNLSQNMTAMSFDPTIEDTGHAIEDAWFEEDSLNAYFSLRIVDDRTLEIQPTAEALLNPDAVKSAKSAICLSVDGRDFTTAPLALTVKKTLPTVKAKAVKINSFDAKPVPLTFTGGKVLSVSGVLPKDFKLDGMNLIYTGSAAKASAKLNLFATVENVTLPRPVTVSVSVTRTEPALKLGASSVTLMPGTQDAAQVTVTPAEDLELELRDARNNVSNALSCIVRDGKISVFPTNSTETDVTYKLYVNLRGASKKSVLSIKTVSADKAKLTLKAAGAIDTAIPNSPVTLTAKIASYHAGSGETYRVTVFNSGENVTDLFRIRQENAVLTITAAGNIPKGTYTAVVGADLNNDGIIDIEKSQKLSVKWSDPNKVPVSVALKASGAIDVIRPGTAVTLTSVFKNWFSFTPSENDLVFYKNKVEMTENIPFTVKIENGNYVISGSGVDSSAKYTVAFRAMIGGKQIVSKAIPLSVKMSAVKVSQSVKTISLLKKDRFDSKIVEITVPDGTKIDHITQNESSVSSFAVEDLGLGRYAISFRNNRVPPKGTTIKLNVYLVGNLTGKPNATVSVKVNIT